MTGILCLYSAFAFDRHDVLFIGVFCSFVAEQMSNPFLNDLSLYYYNIL